MKLRKVYLSVFVGCGLLLISACSSDSGGETGTGIKDKTIIGPITSTATASINVNGINFSTDNANIVFDDVETTQDQLAVGMIVTVNGKVNSDAVSGAAENIVAETEVKGSVFSTAINQDGVGELVVMGRTVTVTANTKFKSRVAGITLADIDTQTVVQVSGYSDNAGNIRATFLKVTDINGDAGEIKVKGVIAELELPNKQFKIDQFTVVFDDDTKFSDVEKEDLQDGLFVKVESEKYDSMNNTLQIIASKIKLDGNDEQHGDEVEAKGLVINVDNLGAVDSADGEFGISKGRLIRVDANTRYKDGDKSNIVLDALLEVEGKVAEDGAIVAKEIEFQDERDDEPDDEEDD